jgi:hypothetical protein
MLWLDCSARPRGLWRKWHMAASKGKNIELAGSAPILRLGVGRRGVPKIEGV